MREILTAYFPNSTEACEGPRAPAAKAVCEREWVERLRRRDAIVFDEMVSTESPKLRLLVQRLLGWEDDAEDVLQEVFIVAWQKIAGFRNESQISTWLASIAINHCRNVVRRRQIWRRCFQVLCLNWTDSGEPTTDRDSAGTAALSKAVARLPQSQREVLVLVALEGKSLQDASDILGIRKNTAEKRLSRARNSLREWLRNDE